MFHRRVDAMASAQTERERDEQAFYNGLVSRVTDSQVALAHLYPNEKEEKPRAQKTTNARVVVKRRAHWDMHCILREFLQNAFDHCQVRKGNDLHPLVALRVEPIKNGSKMVFSLPTLKIVLLEIEIRPNEIQILQRLTHAFSSNVIGQGVVDLHKKSTGHMYSTGGFGVGFKDAAAALLAEKELNPFLKWKMHHPEGEVVWDFKVIQNQPSPGIANDPELGITTFRMLRKTTEESLDMQHRLVQTIHANGIDKVLLENLGKYSIFSVRPIGTFGRWIEGPSIFASTAVTLLPQLTKDLPISAEEAVVPKGIFYSGMYVCDSPLEKGSIFHPMRTTRNSNRAEVPLEDVYDLLMTILRAITRVGSLVAKEAFAVFFDHTPTKAPPTDAIALGLCDWSHHDRLFWYSYVARSNWHREALQSAAFVPEGYAPIFLDSTDDQSFVWAIKSMNTNLAASKIRYEFFDRAKHDPMLCIRKLSAKAIIDSQLEGRLCPNSKPNEVRKLNLSLLKSPCAGLACLVDCCVVWCAGTHRGVREDTDQRRTLRHPVERKSARRHDHPDEHLPLCVHRQVHQDDLHLHPSGSSPV